MVVLILLILVGIIFVLAEIFIIPGVGVSGIIGLLSLVSSCCYAFVYLGVNVGIVVTVLNICLLLCLLIYFLRGKTWKKFELDTSIDTKCRNLIDAEVGMNGKTVTRLAPMGTAEIAGRNCEVTSLDGMLDAGVSIEVAKLCDNKIYVKEVKSKLM